MTQITEDYTSFETAKLLKEKGFDCPCKVWYAEYTSQFSGEKYNSLEFDDYNWFNGDYKFLFYVPTLQMAMKWLREKHKLFIQICIIPHTTITIEQKYYRFTIHKDRRTLAFRKDFPSEYYFTYEEACEAAIKYCLENLI